jgi:hypothetical protein
VSTPLHRLKGATRQLFGEYGSLEAVAKEIGISHSQAGRYQDVRAPDVISIDKVALLESADGVRPHVTRTLAALNGHVLVAMPKVPADGKWSAHLAATAKEAGDVLSRLGEALANDGTVSAAEAAKLLPEVEQAISVLSGVKAALEDMLQPRLFQDRRDQA